MTVSLLPRLSRLGVNQILRELGSEHSPEAAQAYLNEHASFASYGASGGVREPHVALSIASLIRKISGECGFPSPSSQTARAKFDRDAAIALAGFKELASGEGLRDDVWAHFATVLLPDVVRWRFGNATEDRFNGGVRNAFQRLYMRSSALDLGVEAGVDRWRLLRALTEDAHVAIFERPSIGGNPVLARAVARQWTVSAAVSGKNSMERTMRSAIKLLRLRCQIMEIGVLSEDEIATVVEALFFDATMA